MVCLSFFFLHLKVLAFCTLQCNSQCHLKWALDSNKAAHLTVYTFVCLSLSMSVYMHVYGWWLAGLKSLWICSDKWHAALQKAGARWLSKSGYANNWDGTGGDASLESVSWRHTVLGIILSGQTTIHTVSNQTEDEKNCKTFLLDNAGENRQPKAEKISSYYTKLLH